jgi:hypothetical protein
MNKIFYLFLVTIIVFPFISYQYATNGLSNYKSMVYDYPPIIIIPDYQPTYDLLKGIPKRIDTKKCERVCRLAKYLYKKEMRKLKDWWYTWDQLIKAKNERRRRAKKSDM